MRFKYYFLIVLLLGFLIRIVKLGELPFSLHDDELDAGYIGRYILLHKEDIKGNFLPLYYNKFGDYRPAGIFYLSGLSTFLFGINEFAVRFPSAFFGFLTIILMYLFTFELFKNKTIAFYSSLLTALSPWHIVLSRATCEGIIGLFFFLLGLTLVIKGINTSKEKYIAFSFLPFLISYFFYPLFRLLVPLIFIPLPFYKYKKVGIKNLIIFFLFFYFVLSITLFITKSGSGRFSQVAFYKNPILSNTIDKQIMSHPLGTNSDLFITRVFHNKIILYGKEFAKRYLEYFSPLFLFVEGGLPSRYVVPESGLFFFSTIPLLFIGLTTLFVKKDNIVLKSYFLYLLFVAPVVSALTYEDAPNIQRSVFLLAPLIILAAYGLYSLNTIFKKQASILLHLFVCSIILLEFIYFFELYYLHTPSYKSVLRKDGSKALAESLIKNKNSYDKIIMNNAYEMPLYYLFYSKRFEKIPVGSVGENNQISAIDNIVFTKEECPSSKIDISKIKNQKILIVDNGDCSLQNFSIIEEINRQDKTRAFRLMVLKE